MNHDDLHPELRLSPHRKATVTLDWLFFWRQSTRDGIYSVSGALLRTGKLSHARFVGHQRSVQLEWQVDRHITVALNYAHFLTGDFLKQTQPDRSMDYLGAWVTYRF
jgi:hypothetical protein